MAVDELITLCEPTQVRHMMQVIEPQFQRDFISLLPKEVRVFIFILVCCFELRKLILETCVVDMSMDNWISNPRSAGSFLRLGTNFSVTIDL